MGTDNEDGVDQPLQPEVPDCRGVYQPGDVIDLGRSEVKDKQGRAAMTFEASSPTNRLVSASRKHKPSLSATCWHTSP